MRSSSNTLVMKWNDKRDLLMLSTKHDNRMIQIPYRNTVKSKPQVVVDYNAGKSSIDRADQMASYSNPLRRSLKWYRKVAMDLILNISVVNASILFKKLLDQKSQ